MRKNINNIITKYLLLTLVCTVQDDVFTMSFEQVFVLKCTIYCFTLFGLGKIMHVSIFFQSIHNKIIIHSKYWIHNSYI